MNSLIVHFLQIIFICAIWYYAFTSDDFEIIPPDGLDILAVRFIASMLMHLNVEKDVRNGLTMMKYTVNHFDNFRNYHVAFMVSFLLTFCSIAVELTVILVLTSLHNVLTVIMKYVSLAATANIPRFYYNSLWEHKLLKTAGLDVEITTYRRDKPMSYAPKSVKFMRFIQKFMRTIFASWSFYFMPYTSLFINYVVMHYIKAK